jgi:hypothetical protein
MQKPTHYFPDDFMEMEYEDRVSGPFSNDETHDEYFDVDDEIDHDDEISGEIYPEGDDEYFEEV